MGLDRDPVDRASGTTTPPPQEMDTVIEYEPLVMGQEYWVEDDEGEDVWTLGEVVEQDDGRVSVRLVQSGKRREVDRVRKYSQAFNERLTLRGKLCMTHL